MPHTDWRTVRVFISSTFRDMQAERDYLVKHIFPQLRKLCESRGVTWGEVDLRWGVTDEQAAEGKVLPICLEEIHRCRPYFIGILGERYGWVPDEVPADLVAREPWLKEHLEHSVTELEILHGVLNDREMAQHAFFYFRDPAYLNHLPKDADPSDYVSEGDEARVKLADLKDRIRRSGFPYHENYPGPEELGRLVLEDMTAVIDRLYPADETVDPLDRDAQEHEAFAQSRAGVYIGRQEYFDRLDEHVRGDGQPLVVLGESGSGKSALLANWALRYEEARPDALVIRHFIGASPYSADWTAMLRRIMGEFKRKLGVEQEIPDNPDELRSAFPNWLSMAAAKGRVVLILDALNQLEDRDGAPDLVWLPPVVPSNVRLIASSLPGRPLDEMEKREWPVLAVSPFTHDERRDFIREYLAQYTKALAPDMAERISSAPQGSNPLYLKVMLEELRLFGVHEDLNRRIEDYLGASDVVQLYRKVVSRWEEDYEDERPGLVRDAATAIWASRRGLSEVELLDILGDVGEPLSRAVWSPLFLAMGDSLVSRGGLLTFFHDYLRTAVEGAYVPMPEHQEAAHLRLAGYFDKEELGLREVDELPWQLASAQSWPRLLDRLSAPAFLEAAWQSSEFDVRSYWARLEEAGHSMADAYRALIDDPGAASSTAQYAVWSLLYSAGHLEESLALSDRLNDVHRNAGDLWELQASIGNQANILQVRGDLDGAMALLREAERICRELGNEDGLSASLGNQALILKARGDLDGAMALHEEQESICRELGNKDGLSTSLGNQALILKARGDLDGAMALHKEQERICRELGNKDGLSISLGNQALILKARGDLDGAMALLGEVESICRELGNKDRLQVSLGNQAALLQTRGDLDGAMALHREAERIAQELGNKEELAISLVNQGVLLTQRGEREDGLDLARQAYGIASTHGYAALAEQIARAVQWIESLDT